MNHKIRKFAVAAAATAATIAVAAPAHAATDRDIVAAGDVQASFAGSVTWTTPFASNNVSGRLEGSLNWHGVFAGCARLRTQWMTANNAVIDTDVTTVCSNSSLPATKFAVDTQNTPNVRKVRVQVQRKGAFDGSYVNAGSAVLAAADGLGLPF